MSNVYQSIYSGEQIDDYLGRGRDALQSFDVINNLTSDEMLKPLSAAQGKQLAESKVPTTRQINTGLGLEGGGNLSDNRTIKLTDAINSKINDALQPTDVIDNLTSVDTAKPLSAAQGKVLQDTKQPNLESGINIKTFNNLSILGPGNLVLEASAVDHNSLQNYEPERHFLREEIHQLYQPDTTNPFVYTDNAGNLHIDGDIVQNGEVLIVNSEEVHTTQDMIVTREDAVSGIAAGAFSGIRVTNFDGANNYVFGVNNAGEFRAGQAGSELPVAFREESGTSNGVAHWDDANKRFKTVVGFTFDGANLAVPGSVVASNLQISNWNQAYSWGDHSAAGYINEYPTAGITVSNGTGWSSSLPVPAGGLVGTTAEQTLENKTFVNWKQATGSISGTSPTVAIAGGNIKTWTLSGNSTPNINISDGENVILMISNTGNHTVNWGNVKWVDDAGNAPMLYDAAGMNVIVLWGVGAVVYGVFVGHAPA